MSLAGLRTCHVISPVGTDAVHLISSTGTCGVDSALGGTSYTGSGSSTAMSFDVGQVAQGFYKVCYCPSLDGPLDDDRIEFCVSILVFLALKLRRNREEDVCRMNF